MLVVPKVKPDMERTGEHVLCIHMDSIKPLLFISFVPRALSTVRII